MNFKHLIIIFLAWLFNCGVHFSFAQDTISDARQMQMLQEHAAEKNGDFHLHIKIVDEHGKPVKGVHVDASATTFKAWATSDAKSSTDVDGEYSKDFLNCGQISLVFDSPHYHTASKVYEFSAPGSGVVIKGRKHYYDKDTIVLETVAGPVADLRTASRICKWSATKGSDILDISTQIYPDKETRWYKETAPSTATIPGMYLQLVPTSTTIEAEKLNDGDYTTPQNAYLELVVDDGGTSTGFCLVPRNGQSNRDIKIAMKTAPETGYQKRVRITPDMLRDRNGALPLFFYFKILGVYGKGKINGCLYTFRAATAKYPPLEDASVGVNLFVQDDGSRNVLTRE
jgi:hypothetical protein